MAEGTRNVDRRSASRTCAGVRRSKQAHGAVLATRGEAGKLHKNTTEFIRQAAGSAY